jgi:DNA-binding CsgD family transcriptional regulator
LPGLAHVLLLAASRALSVFDVDRPAVAVIAVNPNAELSVRMRSFAATFGLTRAEMSVMEQIVGENVLPAVAAQLGIAHATVRTYLQHIFAKRESTVRRISSTRSQATLQSACGPTNFEQYWRYNWLTLNNWTC